MNNNQKQKINIPGIFVFLAFLVFPPVGIFLAILKYAIQPRTNQRQGNIYVNRDSSQVPTEDYYDDHKEIRQNEIVETFDHTITVRCPHCESSNFTDHLPSNCEYCGELITKKS